MQTRSKSRPSDRPRPSTVKVEEQPKSRAKTQESKQQQQTPEVSKQNAPSKTASTSKNTPPSGRRPGRPPLAKNRPTTPASTYIKKEAATSGGRSATAVKKPATPMSNDVVPTKKAVAAPGTPTSSTKIASSSSISTASEAIALPSSLNDKRIAQRVGLRLRTLLKLPKAHRWVCYEWFYANIDRSLFNGENDFCACLRETFPQLKARKLTRIEWCKVRRLMGKPRRCSPAFFAEERAALNNKRQKVRQLQQQKVVDISHYRDLPDEIPLSLVIGTKVTALLHKPHDGLFTGTIDAVDTANHGYRITFERPGIGTHTVPDYEVLSNDPPEFLPLTSFQTRVRPRFLPMLKSPKFLELLSDQVTQALGGKHAKLNQQLQQSGDHDEGVLGQYPIRLLALMVRVSKILSVKKRRIFEIRSMNAEVERLRSVGEPVTPELQRTYAGTILDLGKLNTDLDDHLRAVQIYSAELSIDGNSLLQPDVIKQRCNLESKEMIERNLTDYNVSDQKGIDFISHLMSLMLHLRTLTENEVNSIQLKALTETLNEIKSGVSPKNIPAYEDNVEIHVNHIKSSANHLGNLGAFVKSVVR